MEIQMYDGVNTPPYEYAILKRNEAKMLGTKDKVFDWCKAVDIIEKEKPDVATAGLAEDWFYTGCTIYSSEDGIEIIKDRGYLMSTWATPVLLLEFENRESKVEECWRFADECPDWNGNTRWPAEALNKFIKQGELIRCGVCSRRRTMCDGRDRCTVFNVIVDPDGYCKWAERRTDDKC